MLEVYGIVAEEEDAELCLGLGHGRLHHYLVLLPLATLDIDLAAEEVLTLTAPFFIKSSITFETLFSFPGIGLADIIIKSFSVISTFLCSPSAILLNADIVSP